MVTERIEFPESVIQGKGDPAQGLVGAQVECGEHPAEVLQGEASDIGIVNNVLIIVPDQKLEMHRGEKNR